MFDTIRRFLAGAFGAVAAVAASTGMRGSDPVPFVVVVMGAAFVATFGTYAILGLVGRGGRA